MTSFNFFAFASGQQSTEAPVIKRYVGIAPVHVVAVNPTKPELEKLLGITLQKDVEYISKTKETNLDQIRLDFFIKTPEDYHTQLSSKVTFFMTNEYFYNRDKTKVQVIDKYGRAVWVTIEQAKNKEIPMYKNGPANIDKDYRPAYRGEAVLVDFLKNYLNIPNVMDYKDGKWVMKENTSDSEAMLTDIANYFKGNVSELKTIISLQPNNKVKVCFGVNSNDGKLYQSVFNEQTCKLSADGKTIAKAIEERKAAGAYSTTEFSTEDLHEYVVASTTFKENTVTNPFADNDPFAPSEDNDNPFN